MTLSANLHKILCLILSREGGTSTVYRKHCGDSSLDVWSQHTNSVPCGCLSKRTSSECLKSAKCGITAISLAAAACD